MRRTYGVLAPSPVLERWFTIFLAVCAWVLLSIASIAIAQTEPITPSGLNTQVSDPIAVGGQTQYNITGGTRPGGGANLFHSFGDFGVPTNNIANFLNGVSFDLAGNQLDPGLPTSNILGRVTGGNISNIFGTLQTSGFGNANLFLMNPAGFLFGPNATVNVSGMVAFTSADYLKLTDNARFNAIPDAAADTLISTLPVAAFGFLGSNPGAITVQGSQFTVTEGSGISLVGGNITIQSGTLEDGTAQPARLSAPGGQITLASAAAAGEILLPASSQGTLTDGQTPSSFGTITLAEGSIVDVSGNPSGIVRIRSGQFVMSAAQIIARNTGDLDGVATAVRLEGDDVNLTNGAQILSVADGQGASGEVDLHATNSVTISGIDATGQVPGYFNEIGLVATGIFSDSPGGGTPGALSITSPHITVSEGGRIHSATSSDANGTAITLTTGTLEVHTGGGILTSSGLDFQTFELRGNGKAGDINILASDSVSVVGLDSFGVASAIQSLPLGIGAGGSIRITTPSVSLNEQGTINTFSFGEGPAGDIILETGSLTVAGGGGITTAGSEFASSGSILISAQEAVSVMDTAPDGTPSRIVNENGGSGGTGFLTINAKDLLVSTGARIRSDTFLTPQVSSDPKLVIHATDSITLAGDQSDIRVMNFLSDVGGMELATQTFTMTGQSTVSTLTFADGNGGPLTITAENMSLSGGSQITSAAQEGSGHAGTIQIQGPQSPADSVVIDGTSTGIFTTTSGTGAGGNITLNADTVTLQNGGTLSAKTSGTEATATGGTIMVDATNTVTMNSASITASSTGTADAGSIDITATNGLTMQNSTITTEAGQGAGGGNIKVTTAPSATVLLQNSRISASVADGPGGGGNIEIDPQYVILQNSQILATVPQGQGGTITITANLFLQDATSIVSADSGSGLHGTVTIQSPNAPASGKIQPLGKSPLLATSLLNQRCAALAGGEFSSFTVAGRDSLPTEPGSWLASPLYAAGMGTGEGLSGLSSLSGVSGVVRGGLAAHQIDQTDQTDQSLLSLRQIAPAGFLTQAFAMDWSAGCQS
jgi:filamentous hemagglutinin family protein